MSSVDVHGGRQSRPLTPLALASTCQVIGGILLANLHQSSRSTLSWGSFLNFFAFKEGMLGTPISVLGGWPTVSGGFVRLGGRAKKPLPKWLITHIPHPFGTSSFYFGHFLGLYVLKREW